MSAPQKRLFAWFMTVLSLAVLIMVSGCNLSGAPEQTQIIQTETPAVTLLPSRTPVSTSGLPATAQFPTLLPTSGAVTAIVVFPTSQPTAIIPPTAFIPPTSQFPLNIAILSPAPGNIIAGNVQVLGSASHPQFLQYQLEWGPDPNPGNLWYPVNAPLFNPVLNGLLGVWNTIGVQDARYQLRLRVYLRDGRVEQTVVSNITVQNRINTPVPSATPVIPRPIAAFTQDVTAGQFPLTVRFFNQSTGTISNLSWNFGDGSTSSEANPVHTFGSPGLYTVQLTVSGPGGSSNVSRQISVTSPTAPVAGFTQDRSGGIAPLTVQFTDQSTGTVTSYFWNFSDGGSSTERNPQHTFTTPGTYNVILTVTGPGGSSSVVRQISVSSAIPPTATLVPPTATFTSTAVPPTPTFTATSLPPTLTETALPLPTNTATLTETPVLPTLTFTATATAIPPISVSYTFNVDLSDPRIVQFSNQTSGGAPPYSYTWDFGDGQFSNEENPTHTFPAGGTYNVRLVVMDATGRSSETTQSVAITVPPTATQPPPPLAVNYTFSVDVGNPLLVQFTDQTSGGVPPYSYTWDFGDGQVSNEQNPAHVFPAGGTYNVRLVVMDAAGVAGESTQSVAVTAPPTATPPPPPLAVNYTFSVDVGNPLLVQFSDQTSGGVPPYSYTWDFGDGQFSNEQNPAHTFPAGGTYNVRLVVMDAAGVSGESTQSVSVTAPPTATPPPPPLTVNYTFTADPSNPLLVQFADQTSGGVPPYSYTWDFGDGQVSNEQNPAHTFPAGGAYNVRLVVMDAAGVSGESTQSVSVTAPPTATPPPPPLAVSYTSTVDLSNPLLVQFTDQTSGGVPPYSYTWDFGDGQVSNEQNPAHTFPAGGAYNVRLVVMDASGMPGEFSQDVVVTGPSPTAAPTPGTADTAPVFPDLNDPRITQIYQSGVGAGNLPSAFAYAGGLPVAQSEILQPFGPGQTYNLASQPELQAIIDWFNQPMPDGSTSFSRTSVAAGANWLASDLLDPNRAGNGCNPGESPLECEMRQTQPVLVFVSVGLNDAVQGVDVATFESTLRQIVNTAASRGVIPVLLTLPRTDAVETARAQQFNEAIYRAAQESGVPVLNIWRLLTDLPQFGISGTTLTASPSGAGDLDAAATGAYGANAVNNALLRFLAEVRTAILSRA